MESKGGGYAVEPIGEPFAGAEPVPVVGTWMLSAETGGYVLDRGAAEILIGNSDQAGTPLRLDTVTQRLHPADRCRFHSAVGQAERAGGSVVAEYRVQTPAGVVWLLDHGRIYRGTSDMPAHGHGVLVDVTRRKLMGSSNEGWDPGPATPLERAAKHALSSRRAIDADGSESLRLLIDMVLLEIGRVIARRVGENAPMTRTDAVSGRQDRYGRIRPNIIGSLEP